MGKDLDAEFLACPPERLTCFADAEDLAAKVDASVPMVLGCMSTRSSIRCLYIVARSPTEASPDEIFERIWRARSNFARSSAKRSLATVQTSVSRLNHFCLPESVNLP